MIVDPSIINDNTMFVMNEQQGVVLLRKCCYPKTKYQYIACNNINDGWVLHVENVIMNVAKNFWVSEVVHSYGPRSIVLYFKINVNIHTLKILYYWATMIKKSKQ